MGKYEYGLNPTLDTQKNITKSKQSGLFRLIEKTATALQSRLNFKWKKSNHHNWSGSENHNWSVAVHQSPEMLVSWTWHASDDDLLEVVDDRGDIGDPVDTKIPQTNSSRVTDHADWSALETDVPTEPEQTAPPRPAIPDAVDFVKTVLPSYSPETHSMSLKEIVDKWYQKVVIQLPDKLKKKPRVSINWTSEEALSHKVYQAPLVAKKKKDFINEDREASAIRGLMSKLTKYQVDGLFPMPTVFLWYFNGLPEKIYNYIRCMVYYLISHETIRMYHPLALTPEQTKALHQIANLMNSDEFKTITDPWAKWLEDAKDFFYQWTARDTQLYEKNWTGKLGEVWYRNLSTSFLKEFILADILEAQKSQYAHRQWFIASDYDDKQLGFDLVCINNASNWVGVVDVTFNKDRISQKLDNLEEFYLKQWLRNSEFRNYYLVKEGHELTYPKTAVLYIDIDLYLPLFLQYISLVKSWQYSKENLKKHVKLYPKTWEWRTWLNNIYDKKFFTGEQ